MNTPLILFAIVTIPGALIATLVPKYVQTRLAFWLANRGSGGEKDYPWHYFEGEKKKRLSLNPFVHFDLLGIALALLARFGWGKELRLNPDSFDRPLFHTAIISITGPVINLVFGVIFSLLLIPIISAAGYYVDEQLWVTFGKLAQGDLFFRYLFMVVFAAAFVNIRVAIFNLIPIPPLDAGQILRAILPKRIRDKFDSIAKYSSYVLLMSVVLITMMQIGWLEKYLAYPAAIIFEITGINGWELISLFGLMLQLPT